MMQFITLFSIVLIFSSLLLSLFLDTYSFFIFMDCFSAGVSHGLLKWCFYSFSSQGNICYISDIKYHAKLSMLSVYLVLGGVIPNCIFNSFSNFFNVFLGWTLTLLFSRVNHFCSCRSDEIWHNLKMFQMILKVVSEYMVNQGGCICSNTGWFWYQMKNIIWVYQVKKFWSGSVFFILE